MRGAVGFGVVIVIININTLRGGFWSRCDVSIVNLASTVDISRNRYGNFSR